MSFSYNLILLDFVFAERSKLSRIIVFNKLHSHCTFIVLNNVKKRLGVLFYLLLMSAVPHFVFIYPVVRAIIDLSLYVAAESQSEFSPTNPAQYPYSQVHSQRHKLKIV